MAVTEKPMRLALPIGFACVVPTAWVLLFFSNRDPFLLGACLLLTLTIGPFSSIILGLSLRKANTGKLFLLSLVIANAALSIAIALMLAYSWLRSTNGYGPG